MRAMPDERREALWAEVLKRFEEIKVQHPNRGSSRSAALINSDGYEVSGIADLTLADGSHIVFHIKARDVRRQPEAIKVTVMRYFHNAEDYWEQQLSDRSNAVVIDGIHYRIGDGNKRHKEHRGYAGREFNILFHDGRRVTTTDLWYQGPIPPIFRDRLPDNATFITGGAR